MGNLLLAPLLLCLEHLLVHCLELVLLCGGLDCAGGPLCVEMPLEREVANDERHPITV